MGRWLPLALVLVLLGGTAVAFGVIEGFKLERSPITAPDIDPTFSPVCRCPQRRALIAFKLRKTRTLTVSVVADGNRLVRTLVAGKRFHGNTRLRLKFHWDGRDEAGALVPDGSYRVRINVGGQHRAIVLPKEIVVDTKPPHVRLVSARPRVISPDGDHRHDELAVGYRVSEPATVRLLVNGNIRVRGAHTRPSGTLYWPGTANGKPLPAGGYQVQLVARDLAGNRSARTPPVLVRIRYVTVSPARLHVRAGSRLRVRVETDARSVRWTFQGRSGVARPGVLSLLALRHGRDALVVEARGHRARATVVVGGK